MFAFYQIHILCLFSDVFHSLLHSAIRNIVFVGNILPSRATKIVLRGSSASQLMEMENEAKRLELSFYLVVDAGRTQVS